MSAVADPAFSILGPLEVRVDGAHVDLGGPRPRTILALLIAAAPHPVSADALVDGVWGEEVPASATRTLQSYVSRLRSVVGTAAIASHPTGYRLRADRHRVDWQHFDDLAAAGVEAIAKNPVDAVERLTEALGLWRGRPFEGVDTATLLPVITRLEDARLAALEARFEARLALGHHAQIAGELEGLVIEHPLRERLWGQLMTALYRAGRQGEALRAYQRARLMLGEELGIEPSAELREIEDLILLQSPELDLEPGDLAASGALLDVTGPDDVTFRFALNAPSITVGRSAGGQGADVELEDPSVSRLQCTLVQVLGAWWVSDEGSKNGTFLHHAGTTTRVSGKVRFEHGDALTIPSAAGEWTLTLADPSSTIAIERGTT